MKSKQTNRLFRALLRFAGSLATILPIFPIVFTASLYGAVTVTQVAPGVGPLYGGNNVSIQGTGFASGATVTFGGTVATSVTVVSATQITAVAPAHATGAVTVAVSDSNGSGSLANAYKYSGGPILTSVAPSSGSALGGMPVILNGYNLGGVTQVLFEATAATIVKTTPTAVSVTSPALSGPANPVGIIVTGPNGTYTLANAYTYTSVSIVTRGLDDAYANFPYSNQLNATGGTAPYTWSIPTGQLPAGISLNPSTGVISGTAAAPSANTFTINASVHDSASPPNSASTSLTFNVVFGFNAGPIPASFFGLIVYDQSNWPTVPVGALGKGLGTTWPFIERERGVYDWSILDQYVADAQSHVVPGLTLPVSLYWTNANVPLWAAADPKTCSAYSGGGSNPVIACTSMVKNIKDFDNFMTALVTRYRGLIQMYELWNEPNIPNVFSGTLAEMAELTAHAYADIRQNDPVALIFSPSSTSASYLDSYLKTPGAPLGFDGVSIHGYPDVGVNDVPEVIVGFKTVFIKQTMLQVPGVGIKPIWDTEGSWGGIYGITDPDTRVAFVARSLLLHWSVGIQRFYWYSWDEPDWGTLWYPPPVGVTPAGLTYGVVFNWMVGASMPTPCTANGGSTYSAVYTCQLTRPGGYSALAVWDTTQTCNNGSCTFSNFTAPPQYTQYRTTTGITYKINPGATIKIGAKPILLETMPAPTGGLPPGQVQVNGSLTYNGLSPVLATTAQNNASLPPVLSSPNLAPTTPPVPGEVTLANLTVKPGLSAPTTGLQAVDSDANIAAGTTQVMQWADFRLQVFDKNINPLGNAVNGNLFWSSASPCSVSAGADGNVDFDKTAQRWLVGMRFGGNQECIGISQTADATQQYYQYTVTYTDPNNPAMQMDWPRIGIWPDAYYLTFDMLDPARDFAPQYAVVCSLQRSAMLAGSSAPSIVCYPTNYTNSTGFFHLMPADQDSGVPPPAGSPNTIFTFAKPQGASQYHLYAYQFHTDYSTPQSSTLTGPVQIDTNAFSSVQPACSTGAINCVPQPPPALWPLDSVGGYLMARASYRNYGSHESLMLTQAVQTSTGSPVGVNWYELRNLQGGAQIYQSGFLQAADSSTTADGFSRWMSSAAMDYAGNMAMGYSISGAGPTSYYSGFPGIAINGRVSTTPLGSLQTEEIVFPGVSVEVPVPPKKTGRWGSVSDIAIDPVDQCTFWFTGQFEPAPGVYNWATQIVSFQMPGCM